MSKKLKPISPGEMLDEEFLQPLEMSKYRLAKEIGIPAQRIGEIIAGRCRRARSAGLKQSPHQPRNPNTRNVVGGTPARPMARGVALN